VGQERRGRSVSDYFKAKYPGTCRCCGYRFHKGASIEQDALGLRHKACEPPAWAKPTKRTTETPVSETFRERAANAQRQLDKKRTYRSGPEL
jgi:hypothetical protein